MGKNPRAALRRDYTPSSMPLNRYRRMKLPARAEERDQRAPPAFLSSIASGEEGLIRIQ